ncbi:MAG: hypothetical protein WBB82_10450 [Limnothrix sp.]
MTADNNPENEKEAIAATVALLNHYGFDLGGQIATDISQQWQQLYPSAWLRNAVLEALYRGRYKKVSVEEILRQWQKKGDSQTNFDSHFEAIMCAELKKTVQEKVQLQSVPIQPSSATKSSEIESFQPEPINFEIYQKLKAIAKQADHQIDDILNPEISELDKQ